MAESNLATSWANVQDSKAAGLRRLNAALGTRYRQNRLYEWMSGRPLPEPVRAWMLQDGAYEILKSRGVRISKERAAVLAEALR